MPAWLRDDAKNNIPRKPYWLRLWYAQPVWADVKAIRAIYKEATERRANGEEVEVDHIYPLNGADICGLHIASNLRIIPKSENAKRSNHTYPGQPCQQLDLFHESIASPDFELRLTNDSH